MYEFKIFLNLASNKMSFSLLHIVHTDPPLHVPSPFLVTRVTLFRILTAPPFPLIISALDYDYLTPFTIPTRRLYTQSAETVFPLPPELS